MDILDLNYAEVEAFFFVFFRVGAMFLFMPILGSRQIPTQMKIGLAFLMSITIFPAVQPTVAAAPIRGIFDLATYLFAEVTIGFGIGFTARLIFTAVQIAGTVIDFQMGFGVVNVIDPQTESSVSVTAQFQNILAILLFLTLDAHHIMIQAVTQSFFLIDVSAINLSSHAPEVILNFFVSSFAVAIRIAAPAMAILFFIAVGLGLVARTVPQMNVFIVGFPLQIGVGLVMVAISMSFFSIIIQNQINLLPAQFKGLLSSF